MQMDYYEELKQKAIESKVCVHFQEVEAPWNISNEDVFTKEWFR